MTSLLQGTGGEGGSGAGVQVGRGADWGGCAGGAGAGAGELAGASGGGGGPDRGKYNGHAHVENVAGAHVQNAVTAAPAAGQQAGTANVPHQD